MGFALAALFRRKAPNQPLRPKNMKKARSNQINLNGKSRL
jgi:hypothetical protein